jgi:DNA uptake protein ComE-like DNA-binding protein
MRRTSPRSTATPSAAGSEPGQERARSPRVGNAEEVLNSATRQQLLSVYGIGPVLADRIIQNRPYAAAYDVVEQGIIPETIFVQLRKQLLDRGA